MIGADSFPMPPLRMPSLRPILHLILFIGVALAVPSGVFGAPPGATGYRVARGSASAMVRNRRSKPAPPTQAPRVRAPVREPAPAPSPSTHVRPPALAASRPVRSPAESRGRRVSLRSTEEDLNDSWLIGEPPPPPTARVAIQDHLGAPPAGAEARLSSEAATEETTPLHIDFKDVDLSSVLQIISRWTGKNYIYAPNVLQGKKINMLGPAEFSKAEAEFLMRSLLEYYQLTIEDLGAVQRIVPKAEGRFRNITIRRDQRRTSVSPLAKDKMVVQLIRPRYRKISELAPTLQNFLSGQGSQIIQFAPTNLLIVIESQLYIERMMRILEELDTPSAERHLVIIPLRYNYVGTILGTINKILGQQAANPVPAAAPDKPAQTNQPPPKTPAPSPVAGGPKTKPLLLADEGRNSLVVISDAEDLAYIQELVSQLDVDPRFAPMIEFVKLKHTDPETVTKLISDMMKGDPSAGSKTAKAFTLVADKRTQSLILTTLSPNSRARVLALIEKLDIPVAQADRNVRVYRLQYAEAKQIAEILEPIASEETNVSVARGEGTTGTAIPRPPSAPRTSQGDKPPQVKVIADEPTNSLVIIASKARYDELVSIIRELDVVRPQVLVEVLVARIDVNRARALGLDFNVVDQQSNSKRPFAIGSTGQLASAFTPTGVAAGLNIGILDSGDFDIGAASTGNLGELSKIGLLINVLANDTNANILSAPKILTADNEEASIIVGQQVRIPQGSTLNSINTITNFITEDLGVILRLTPRITKNDFVSMKLKVQIKNLVPDVQVAGIPVIANNDIETNLSVPNQSTIVLGGLLEETRRKSVQKIPILGDIPLLGKLFRETNTQKEKSNLIVFLTPSIVRSQSDIEDLTDRHQDILESHGIGTLRRTEGGQRRESTGMIRSLGR